MHNHKQPEWAKKRAGRLRRSCVSEVLDAVSRGYISPSTVDKFYRSLPAAEQREKISALVTRKDRERSRCQLVVEILRRHIESGEGNLHRLRQDLVAALSSSGS
jgi:hypothetical protein